MLQLVESHVQRDQKQFAEWAQSMMDLHRPRFQALQQECPDLVRHAGEIRGWKLESAMEVQMAAVDRSVSPGVVMSLSM